MLSLLYSLPSSSSPHSSSFPLRSSFICSLSPPYFCSSVPLSCPILRTSSLPHCSPSSSPPLTLQEQHFSAVTSAIFTGKFLGQPHGHIAPIFRYKAGWGCCLCLLCHMCQFCCCLVSLLLLFPTPFFSLFSLFAFSFSPSLNFSSFLSPLLLSVLSSSFATAHGASLAGNATGTATLLHSALQSSFFVPELMEELLKHVGDDAKLLVRTCFNVSSCCVLLLLLFSRLAQVEETTGERREMIACRNKHIANIFFRRIFLTWTMTT